MLCALWQCLRRLRNWAPDLNFRSEQRPFHFWDDRALLRIWVWVQQWRSQHRHGDLLPRKAPSTGLGPEWQDGHQAVVQPRGEWFRGQVFPVVHRGWGNTQSTATVWGWRRHTGWTGEIYIKGPPWKSTTTTYFFINNLANIFNVCYFPTYYIKKPARVFFNFQNGGQTIQVDPEEDLDLTFSPHAIYKIEEDIFASTNCKPDGCEAEINFIWKGTISCHGR